MVNDRLKTIGLEGFQQIGSFLIQLMMTVNIVTYLPYIGISMIDTRKNILSLLSDDFLNVVTLVTAF